MVNSKVLIAGDSMSQGVGVMLEAFAAEKGLQVESIGKASTGLTRPDYFDWPARLLEATAASDPGVVVLMFGGNDGQPITDASGQAYQVADPGWAVEYGSRVAHVMDQLGAEGRKVVWIGSPNSSSSNMNKRLTVINQVLQQQAATRPWVTYLDAWALFAAPDGSFVASLPDADGQVRRMRNKDGYHLTIDGYKYLARATLGLGGAGPSRLTTTSHRPNPRAFGVTEDASARQMPDGQVWARPRSRIASRRRSTSAGSTPCLHPRVGVTPLDLPALVDGGPDHTGVGGADLAHAPLVVRDDVGGQRDG